MENEQVQQPVSSPVAAAPLADLALADYRATREPAATEKAAPAPSTPDNSGDELEADGTPEQIVERKKKQGGYQKTISRQTDEIAELKRQLGEKSGTPAAAPAVTPAAAAAAPAAAAVPEPVYDVAKPKLEDCEGIEDFAEKLSDWKQDERDWKREAKATTATQQAKATAAITNWNAQKEAFKADHEDYDAALASVSEIKLSGEHQKIFLESPHGVALAYELANDPEALKAIAAMTPLKAAVAIGKLEAKYDADEAPEPEIKVSSAPKPFKAISGNATRTTPNAATLSHADYRKARESGRLT